MRIAIIASSLPPNSIGGAEIQAESTAVRLAERGHQVTVFARAVPGDTVGAVHDRGVLWVRSGAPAAPGLSFIGHVLSFLRDWRRHDGGSMEVVLAYQLVIAGVLGTLVTGAKRPLISWIRSEVEVQTTRSRKYRWLSPFVLSRSRTILVQSERIAATLATELAATKGAAQAGSILEKCEVLANAIALGEPPGYANRSGLVTLGRLVQYKALEVLLDALGRLAPPPPLRILGDGPLRRELEQAAAKLPVTFEGAIAPTEVAARVAGSRVMVSSSRSEGFPNAILEGMERGLPAVATRVGAVADVVRDGVNGFLVDPEDAEGLASAIERILADDAAWDRMARSARATAESYGWNSHLDRLESVLGS